MVSVQHLTLYKLSTFSVLGNVEILLRDVALNLKLPPLRCSSFLGLPGVSPVLLEFLFRQKNAESVQRARILFQGREGSASKGAFLGATLSSLMPSSFKVSIIGPRFLTKC